MKIVLTNPNTKEVIGEISTTGVDEIPVLVEKAKEAQLKWKNYKLEDRLNFLKKVKKLIYSHREEFAQIISQENGKPIFESYSTEIIPTLNIIDYYLKNSKIFLKPHYERIKLPVMIHKKSWIEYEPYGVIGIISPWNYPLFLPMGQIIPGLVAGNSVIFKPSEWTPLTGQMIDGIFKEVNLPENLFQTIYGDSIIGNALVKSNIDKLFFTGSTYVGKIISKDAAEKLLPVSLELGGKDPAIVLEDADLERAAMG
ncbi:MAG: aldehyde dehydrogenase family protein, partial [Caldimicrobium sp.]